jgi:phospholipase/carboxylesterase
MSLRAISLSEPNQSADQLLVLMHGWGANAQDVAGLAPYLHLTGFQMIFPEGPFPHPMAPGGRMWYNFPPGWDFRTPFNFVDQPDLQESQKLLKEWLLGLEAATGIPLERTILGGFSQGGAMTIDLGPQLPLAGMLILSGYSHGPIPPAVSERPIVMIHGRQDLVVPIDKARDTKAELLQQGMSVEYHEFDMGHEISLEVLKIVGSFCQSPV